MKKYALNDITFMQYVFLLHGAQIGVGLISLPNMVGEVAGMDSWITLIISWAISLGVSLLIISIMKKHPDETLYDLLPRYFGKVAGTALNLVFILYFLYAFYITFTTSVFIINLQQLPKTPNSMIVLLFAVPLYTVARSHIRVIGRYAELTYWLFIWLLLLYMYPLRDAVWVNLLPVLREGWGPVLQGLKMTVFSFLGFETAFILYPFLKHKEMAVKGIVIANSMTLIIYLVIVLVCFLFFSPDDISHINYPTIKVLKVIEFRFFERFDVIILLGYIILLSRIWIIYIYYGVFGSSQLFGKQDHRSHLRIVVLVLIVSSIFYSPTSDQITLLDKGLSRIGFFTAYMFPVLLWIVVSLRRRFSKGAIQ